MARVGNSREAGDRPWPAEGQVARLFGDPGDRAAALAAEPGLHGVLGQERAFAASPAEMDFLDPRSPFFDLKALSTRLYLRFFEPFLATVPRGAAALDAGCGIGRFTALLARRFARVTALDACPSALAACQRHLTACGLANVDLHWADLSALDAWPAERFDLVLAAELLCYVADPAAGLRRLVRATRPGGLVLLSVEGRPGTLAVRGAPGPAALVRALSGKPVLVPEDRFLVFFDERELRALLAEAGLTGVTVQGLHYLPEGPFWQAVDDARLADPAYADQIAAAEEHCRSDPSVAPWARVFAAAGRKP